jgi:hypothetical protein
MESHCIAPKIAVDQARRFVVVRCAGPGARYEGASFPMRQSSRATHFAAFWFKRRRKLICALRNCTSRRSSVRSVRQPASTGTPIVRKSVFSVVIVAGFERSRGSRGINPVGAEEGRGGSRLKALRGNGSKDRGRELVFVCPRLPRTRKRPVDAGEILRERLATSYWLDLALLRLGRWLRFWRRLLRPLSRGLRLRLRSLSCRLRLRLRFRLRLRSWRRGF